MGRTYAGVLGSLAMTVIVFRGYLASSGVEATLWQAVGALIVFSSIGAILGQLAQSTVEESVRSTLEEQLSEKPSGT
ncbi:MAG: hypothetical protein IT425_09145 [Pirellulales bacterium]|nr:hypothetical protein [Pirellulales bacterium]